MQTTTTPSAISTLTPHAMAIAAQRDEVLSHYDQAQQEAAMVLYRLVKTHGGTSGGNAAAKLLIGLYNGKRFPVDLTELRVFDPNNLKAAFTVLRMDAMCCWCEIHELLNAILNVNYVGHEFEVWAYNLRLKGRCTKEGYLESCKRAAA